MAVRLLVERMPSYGRLAQSPNPLVIATYCILWIHMARLEVLFTQYLHGCLRKIRCCEHLITSFPPEVLYIVNQKILVSRSIIPLQCGLRAQNHPDEETFWNHLLSISQKVLL